MVMRKWLEGARILRFHAIEGERIAEIDFESRNELGDKITLTLVVEIMGKHSNIILLDNKRVIIDGIRRYGSNLSRWREVLPGRPYIAPPPIEKLALPPDSIEQLAHSFYKDEELSLARALRDYINGISPLLAEHIALSAGLSPQQSIDELGDVDFQHIYEQLCTLKRQQQQAAYQPTLLLESAPPAIRRYRDFHAIPLRMWEGHPQLACASMNQAVDLLYSAREEEQSIHSYRQRIYKQIRHHISRLNKKISLQQTDLNQCVAADVYREAGDLLAANLYFLRKGMDEVAFPSFINPDKTVSIQLDPALTPQENIQSYYRRYSKAKHAKGRIEEQLTANMEELAYVQSIEQCLADCSSLDEIKEIEREAISAGYLKPTVSSKSKNGKATKTAKSQPIPPRRFISRDGFTVLIGRNNKQNDKLSLHQAHTGDIWLHTQKIPGAHVLIVSEGRAIPPSTIQQAAAWAAWFSKAKESAQVPVDWLPAERLRKPPMARPGYVIYSGQKTVYINPANPEEETQ